MKRLFLFGILMVVTHLILGQVMKKELTDEEKRVIVNKGTERPYTGKYYNSDEKGTYTCKQCGAAFIVRMISLIQDVDGPVLMMKLPER